MPFRRSTRALTEPNWPSPNLRNGWRWWFLRRTRSAFIALASSENLEATAVACCKGRAAAYHDLERQEPLWTSAGSSLIPTVPKSIFRYRHRKAPTSGSQKKFPADFEEADIVNWQGDLEHLLQTGTFGALSTPQSVPGRLLMPVWRKISANADSGDGAEDFRGEEAHTDCCSLYGLRVIIPFITEKSPLPRRLSGCGRIGFQADCYRERNTKRCI